MYMCGQCVVMVKRRMVGVSKEERAKGLVWTTEITKREARGRVERTLVTDFSRVGESWCGLRESVCIGYHVAVSQERCVG